MMQLRWEEFGPIVGHGWLSHLYDDENNLIAFVESGWPDDLILAETEGAPLQYRGRFLGKWTNWAPLLTLAQQELIALIYNRASDIRWEAARLVSPVQ